MKMPLKYFCEHFIKWNVNKEKHKQVLESAEALLSLLAAVADYKI